MKNSYFLILVLSFFAYNLKAQQTFKKPNIIFILADDLGYGDTEPYGQTKIKTPCIAKLSQEGMVYTQFYAGTSVCAPSRSSLMTGMHTGHTFIRGNKEVEPEGQQPIPDYAVTVAELMKNAGYTTGIFGKWGLGPVGSDGDPLKQGFDRFYGYNSQLLAHRYYPTHIWDNETKVNLDGNTNLLKPTTYAPELIQQKALQFLDDNKSKSFMLFLTYNLPHAELLTPDDSIFLGYKGKFDEKPFVGNDYGPKASEGGYTSQQYPHATFASMVTRLDMYVGQVMDKLKALGIDDNTLVIFTSDNGPHKEGGADPDFFNSGGGLRGYKRDLYEGGVREPFIVRWPGKVKAGTKNDYVGAFWDVLPTFAQIAGIKAPSNIDGISFLPSLLNKKQPEHNFLYFEFHENGGKQSVRKGDWKAIRLNVFDKSKTTVELYNLSNDSAEKNNIASSNPSKVQELIKLMDESHVESPIFPFNESK